jgi:DNA repair protein RadC
MNQQFVIRRLPNQFVEVNEQSISNTIKPFNHPQDISDYWHAHIGCRPDFVLEQERIDVILLDSTHTPTGWTMIALGGVNFCKIRIAEIMRPAIVSNSPSFVMIHNHPSGDVESSPADRSMTRQLQQATELFGINLADHLIVHGQNKQIWYSFRQRGLL